jgi:transcription elongation factor GreB
MTLELAGLALAALLAWLWFDSLRAREAAFDAARRACEADGVQLLDDTVALARSRLRRDAAGHIAILREYRFEFSDTGDNRLRGSVTLLGRQVQVLHVEPRGSTQNDGRRPTTVATRRVRRYKWTGGRFPLPHFAPAADAAAPARDAVSPSVRAIMSRAFVKESADDLVAGELPERPLPEHSNYVTPRGFELLQARVRELNERYEQCKRQAEDDSEAKQKLREVERDLRYFIAQIERAEVVDTAQQARDQVRFGATVRLTDESGQEHEFSIVGDDEADVAAGRISWASPLARALIGAKVGDIVVWHRPAGDAEVEIVEVRYP